MTDRSTLRSRQDRAIFGINATGFLLIGLASLGYVRWDRDFAELHFLLPFFGGLPLFPGEILWVICFGLTLLQLFGPWKTTRYPFWVSGGIHMFWSLLILYGIWLLAKVVLGLINFGPLALRHAALFYYPLFAVFGFLFYDKRFFSKKTILILVGAVLVIFAQRQYNEYWTLTLSSLAVILVIRLGRTWVRTVMGALVFLTIPYYAFFSTSRMMIVANSVSLAILGFGLKEALVLKRSHKVLILIFFIIGIVAAVGYSLFTKSTSRVFVGPRFLIESYQFFDRDVQAARKIYKKPFVPSKIYCPEEDSKFSAQFASLVKTSALSEPNKVTKSGVGFIVPEDEDPSKSPKTASPSRQPVYPQATAPVMNPPILYLSNDARSEHEAIKSTSTNNIIFRLLIWRDMWNEWRQHRPLWGFDFGYPLRSESLEILGWAQNEWGRIGWVEPHNSYFHFLYRAGIFGFVFIAVILGLAIWSLTRAFAMRSLTAIALSSIVWNWMVAANFLIILEIPYTAIPFWALFGINIAYVRERSHIRESKKGA